MKEKLNTGRLQNLYKEKYKKSIYKAIDAIDKVDTKDLNKMMHNMTEIYLNTFMEEFMNEFVDILQSYEDKITSIESRMTTTPNK